MIKNEKYYLLFCSVLFCRIDTFSKCCDCCCCDCCSFFDCCNGGGGGGSYKILVCGRKVKDLKDTFERLVNNKYEGKGDYYVGQGSSDVTKCSFYVKKDAFVGLDKSFVIPSDDEKKGFNAFLVVIDCYDSVEVEVGMLALQLCHAMMSQPFVYFFCVGDAVPSDHSKLDLFFNTLLVSKDIYFYAAVFMYASFLKGQGIESGWNYGTEIDDFYSSLANAAKNITLRTTEQ